MTDRFNFEKELDTRATTERREKQKQANIQRHKDQAGSRDRHGRRCKEAATVKKDETPLQSAQAKKGFSYERTVEEIKDRYYQCVFAVVRARY